MKRLVSLMLVLGLLLTLCSCGQTPDKDDDSTSATQPSVTQPTEKLLQEDIAGKVLQEGDRMVDLTITDMDGQSVSLSTLLEEKELVILNFWYVDCVFCVREFPAMSEAYAEHKEQVAIYALNPMDKEFRIKQFRTENAHLQFPMATCPMAWAQAFNITGFPTTVVIGKDGIIQKVHTGAYMEKSEWEDLFAEYM